MRCIRPLLVLAPGLACAGEAPTVPTFDCARARGAVEQQICADARLAALDRQLDQVYRAASAKAQGRLGSVLRAEQRGWVKGRNECWKAQGQETWITATWTVKTVAACIDAQYRLRTSELQATWRLLPSKTVSYACQDQPGSEVVATFFASAPATIRLERGDRSATLWQVGGAASGTYEGQNLSLVHQGSRVKVSWLNTRDGNVEELDCTAH